MLLIHDLMSKGKITNPVTRATDLVRVGIYAGNGKWEMGNGKWEMGKSMARETESNKKGELMLSFS
ncbi:hypothetical protein [Vibrio owensii]|uniref:hypothetical protein n=1 Tax=Vibrio owensii TaxID=696485 RepID=UPI0018F17217|nr:hypothetical protein [Vibrio owensii]